MAILIAVLCAITILICVPLVVLKPTWVFYTFLFFVTFSSIFTGYINEAGNLGLPMTWAPADFLAWLTLFAAFFVHREKLFRAGVIKKCVIILALMSGFALAQGLIIHPRTALTHSRVTHFVAAAIFGLRYFTDYSRVMGLLKFTVILLLVMFAIHVGIRFGIYTPPVAEFERVVDIGGLAGERGNRSLIPMLYLVLISIAIGRLVSKVGSIFTSVFILLVGIGGVILSETRSMYGALALLMLASVIFIKGRIKNLILYGLVGLIAVSAATAIGFDFLSRFRTDYGRGYYALPSFYELRSSWRGIEYETIVSSYKQGPYFILTGRGIGALHPAPIGKKPEVGFYHSEYLGWLDRCGLIGLFTLIVLILACLWRSFTLARIDIPYLRYYGVTCFLLIIALAADGLFHPILSHHRGASLLICFAAIMANWQYIYLSLFQEPEFLPNEVDQELA